MNKLFLLALLLATSGVRASSTVDSVPRLEVGKRYNWLINRSIREENMGRWYGAANRIFYRSASHPDYTPIGFMGKHIEPYFSENPMAKKEFMAFRKNRAWGMACYVAAVGTSVYTIVQMPNWFTARFSGAGNADYSSVGLAVGLVSTIGLSILSNVLNMHSERHLLKAVGHVNGLYGGHSPEKKRDICFDLVGDRRLGMGIRMKF